MARILLNKIQEHQDSQVQEQQETQDQEQRNHRGPGHGIALGPVLLTRPRS